MHRSKALLCTYVGPIIHFSTQTETRAHCLLSGGIGNVLAQSHTGEAAIAVRIRAYGASGHLALEESNVLQGTRLLLICDAKELPEGYVVVSYKWYHSCSTGRCEI